jgi:glycosyltransferase involved in cell wall biosynthesis
LNEIVSLQTSIGSSIAPQISIIIPTTGSTEDLADLIRSIENQTFGDLEIVIVPTSELNLQSVARLKVLSPPKSKGASFARNIGASSARGRVLAFLDSDVVLDAEWCRYLIESFSDLSVGAVSGRADTELSPFRLEYIPPELLWVVGGTYWPFKTKIAVNGAAGMNFSVVREVFFRAGGYNTSIGPFIDRPELSDWRRIGAEEDELAYRISSLGVRVIYNPRMVVNHKLNRRSVTTMALAKRALHVGHNRAVVHRFSHSTDSYSPEFFVLIQLLVTLSKSLLGLRQSPVTNWKRISFSVFVLFWSSLGFVFGKIETFGISYAVSKRTSLSGSRHT